MNIKQIAHMCIGAKDLAAAEDFYCNKLGMERGFDFLKDGELYGFYVKCGANTFIEIFIDESTEDVKFPIIYHLCLEVDDLDAVIAELQDKGVEVTEKKQGGDKSYQAWITDPHGVPIELMQYTDESSQFTGNPCIVDW